MRASIAASTSPSPARSDGSGAWSVKGTPSMRWTVPSRRTPPAAVANATRAAAAVSVARGSSDDRGDPAQVVGGPWREVAERVEAHDERRVRLASLQQARGAELPGPRPRMPAREAHCRRVAGLPGQHVLGAPRVALPPQRQRDDVRDAGQVAHEREQSQRVRVPGGPVQHRPVFARAQAAREVLEGVQRQPRSEVAIERDVAHQSAHGPQRLEVELGRQLDELVRLLGGRRAPRVDDDQRAPIRASGAIEPQAGKQPRMGGDRVGAPGHDQLGPVAELAECGRAQPDGLRGRAGGSVVPGPDGIDHGAHRLGQRHRRALALTVGLAEAAHERKPGLAEDRGRRLDRIGEVHLAAVDAGHRGRVGRPLGEPLVADRAGAACALERSGGHRDLDVVASTSAARTGRRVLSGHEPKVRSMMGRGRSATVIEVVTTQASARRSIPTRARRPALRPTRTPRYTRAALQADVGYRGEPRGEEGHMARSLSVGESLVGDGAEVAHIDLLIGPKDGPVGEAFASALLNQKEGHTNLLAVVAPNLPAKPDTIMANKVTLKGEAQVGQMFGPAQAAVARAVVDSVRDGVISADEADDLCIIVGVFIHWQAQDDKKIFDWNYQATKESIARAMGGEPAASAVIEQAAEARHPFASGVEA